MYTVKVVNVYTNAVFVFSYIQHSYGRNCGLLSLAEQRKDEDVSDC